jgi:uncharacterized ferritin-like protein (DUF455 family)
MSRPTLTGLACRVLTTGGAMEKIRTSHAAARQWFAARDAGDPLEIGTCKPPDHPARPARPELLAPRQMPKRKPGTEAGRIALLHAIAHIELNAVDLHWDIIARFSHIDLPRGFYDDWVKAADDESNHFNLLCDRLQALGSHYGALPAHQGMWRAATDTVADFQGRLAIVPMVLEARGLDVTPNMITLFKGVGDAKTAAALEQIYAEEVAHVAYGSKWFHFMCGRHNHDPKERFHQLVRTYFHAGLRPPFNEEKRAEAGLPPDFYWPLVENSETGKS